MGAKFGRLVVCVGSVAGLLGSGDAALADETPPGDGQAENREIVVNGNHGDPLADLVAEAELDEQGIAAYGHDTVAQLLGEVLRQVDNAGDGPIVLIDGRPVSGINSISDLPAEAVTKIQLLPRSAAARLGEQSSRRVVNVVLKPSLRQATASGLARMATAGGAFSTEGELNLIALNHGNRSSLVLGARHNDPLFESERPLAASPSALPFDMIGNVLPSPASAAEIDPALSALAGQTVRIAGIPEGVTQPALADFLALANQARVTVPPRNRSLVAEQEQYSLNGNLIRNLGQRTSLSVNLRAVRNQSAATTGTTSASLLLPASSPYSPFGQDVILARYVGEPLRNENQSTNLSFAAIINGAFGKWRVSAGASILHQSNDGLTERAIDLTDFQSGIANGSINPFGADPGLSLIPPTDRSRARIDEGRLFATIAGSPLRLPAGPLRLSLRGEWKANRVVSSTFGAGIDSQTELRRDETALRLSLAVPVIDSPALGELDMDLSGTLHHVTASGTLRDGSAALTWRPGTAVSLRAAFSEERIAPPANLLTDPIVVTDNVRTFDFVRGETVFVRQITGGNPALDVETRRTTSFSANLLPFGTPDIALDAEFSRVVNLDPYSALPAANAAVQTAFPDRFQRDETGQLIQIDARPVSYARLGRSQIRWGLSFRHTFRSASRAASTAGTSDGADEGNVLAPGLRINAFVSHLWTLSNTQLVRAGLPVIDVLDGGASAIASGSTRHVVQFGGGAARNGVGLQVSGSWFGPRRTAAGTLDAPSRIDFAARAQVDLRLFANLGPVFPQSPLAKGFRVSLEAENLFDSSQRVTDSQGLTPARYQRYLMDPTGRRIAIKLRKVF